MRNPFVILLLLILTVSGVSGVIWYMQAERFKEHLEKSIANINTGPVQITYDVLETSGFPLEVAVSLVNPKIKMRLDPLIEKTRQPAETQQPMQPWEENWALEGKIQLGVSALGDSYTLKSDGILRGTGNIDGQAITTSSQNDDHSADVCTLRVDRGLVLRKLWGFESLTDNIRESLKNFRSLDCVFGKGSTVNSQTSVPLITGNESRFYITHMPQGSQRNIRFNLKYNVEFSQEADRIFAIYYHALAPYYLPPKLSLSGAQDVDMDFSFDAPADWDGKNLKAAPLDIRFVTNAASTQAGSASLAFQLANADGPAGYTSKLNSKMEFVPTEITNTQVQDGVRDGIQQIYYSPDMAAMRATMPAFSKYAPETLFAIIRPAIPNIYSLGKEIFAIDGTYQGNREFTAGDATLNAFELSTVLYGITGKGTAKLNPQTPFPAANLSFTCKNCLRMIDDMADYTARLQKVMLELDPANASALPVTPAMLGGIKSFLQALATAETAAPNDFIYVIVSDGMMGITINGKPMDQVMALSDQYITPTLPKPKAQ